MLNQNTHDKKATLLAQVFRTLADASPDPSAYDYLCHTVNAGQESLNTFVGTLCGLVDEYRDARNVEQNDNTSIPPDAVPAIAVPEHQATTAPTDGSRVAEDQRFPANIPAWFVQFMQAHRGTARTKRVGLHDHPKFEVEEALIRVMTVQDLMDKAPELIERYHLALAQCECSVGREELNTLDEADAILGHLYWCLGKRIVECTYQEWSEQNYKELVCGEEDDPRDEWCGPEEGSPEK
jgi:hypothetical protein